MQVINEPDYFSKKSGKKPFVSGLFSLVPLPVDVVGADETALVD